MPPADRAVLALAVDQIRIIGIDAAYKAIPTADGDPIFVDHAATLANRRPAPGTVVLQAAHHPVRLSEADCDVIKLPQRRRVDVVPVAAAVVTGIKPAVTANEHVP